MKPGVHLVNVARGPMIEDDALRRALDADIVACASIDSTDPEPLPGEIEGLKERPEAANLVGIYAAMAGISQADVLAQFAGQGFGAFKPALGELLVEKLSPITARYSNLRTDTAALDAILAAGAQRARALAVPTLEPDEIWPMAPPPFLNRAAEIWRTML
jgi:hypothetical protein